MKECKSCGVEFTPRPQSGNHRIQVYCDEKCQIDFNKRRKNEMVARIPLRIVKCLECEKEHYFTGKLTCSLECRRHRASKQSLAHYHGLGAIKKNNRQERANKIRRDDVQTNPISLIKARVRCRISNFISLKKINKSKRTEELIGCSWISLQSHIESLFTKGMTWENRHLWHLDHIVPLSKAFTEPDIIKLCHFSNLRPMWAKDNWRKHAKIVTCQPELAMSYL